MISSMTTGKRSDCRPLSPIDPATSKSTSFTDYSAFAVCSCAISRSIISCVNDPFAGSGPALPV